MLRAAVCRAAPCRALLRPPSLVKLRLDSSFHRPSVKLATAAPSFCTSRPIHTTYRPRITGAIELSQRSFSNKPTQSSSVPSTSSSPPPTPHVDLLSKYGTRDQFIQFLFFILITFSRKTSRKTKGSNEMGRYCINHPRPHCFGYMVWRRQSRFKYVSILKLSCSISRISRGDHGECWCITRSIYSQRTAPVSSTQTI